MTKGIDISKWQGTISAETFKKFKNQNIEFVIIRAYAGGKDSCFEQNYKNAVSAGLAVGSYCYIYGKSVEAVKREAENFLNAVLNILCISILKIKPLKNSEKNCLLICV